MFVGVASAIKTLVSMQEVFSRLLTLFYHFHCLKAIDIALASDKMQKNEKMAVKSLDLIPCWQLPDSNQNRFTLLGKHKSNYWSLSWPFKEATSMVSQRIAETGTSLSTSGYLVLPCCWGHFPLPHLQSHCQEQMEGSRSTIGWRWLIDVSGFRAP